MVEWILIKLLFFNFNQNNLYFGLSLIQVFFVGGGAGVRKAQSLTVYQVLLYLLVIVKY